MTNIAISVGVVIFLSLIAWLLSRSVADPKPYRPAPPSKNTADFLAWQIGNPNLPRSVRYEASKDLLTFYEQDFQVRRIVRDELRKAGVQVAS